LKVDTLALFSMLIVRSNQGQNEQGRKVQECNDALMFHCVALIVAEAFSGVHFAD
jgi:hypothetical protein